MGRRVIISFLFVLISLATSGIGQTEASVVDASLVDITTTTPQIAAPQIAEPETPKVFLMSQPKSDRTSYWLFGIGVALLLIALVVVYVDKNKGP